MSETNPEIVSDVTNPIQARLLEQKKLLKSVTTKVVEPCGSTTFFADQGGKLVCKGNNSSGFVVDNSIDLQCAAVRDWLLLSSQDAATDLDTLLSYKITHILSLLPNFELPECIRNSVAINHMCIPLYDEVSVKIGLKNSKVENEILNKGLQFINEVKNSARDGARILVHCNAGVSRAPTIIILYLMLYEKLPFTRAYNEVKNVRNCIKPNDGFLSQLKSINVGIQ